MSSSRINAILLKAVTSSGRQGCNFFGGPGTKPKRYAYIPVNWSNESDTVSS